MPPLHAVDVAAYPHTHRCYSLSLFSCPYMISEHPPFPNLPHLNPAPQESAPRVSLTHGAALTVPHHLNDGRPLQSSSLPLPSQWQPFQSPSQTLPASANSGKGGDFRISTTWVPLPLRQEHTAISSDHLPLLLQSNSVSHPPPCDSRNWRSAPLFSRAPVSINGGEGVSEDHATLPATPPISSDQVLQNLYRLMPWLSAIATDPRHMTAMATASPQNSPAVVNTMLHSNNPSIPSQVVSLPFNSVHMQAPAPIINSDCSAQLNTYWINSATMVKKNAVMNCSADSAPFAHLCGHPMLNTDVQYVSAAVPPSPLTSNSEYSPLNASFSHEYARYAAAFPASRN